MSEPDALEPMNVDEATLRRIAELCEPHSHAMLTAIRREFPDDVAPRLFALVHFMCGGNALANIQDARTDMPAMVGAAWEVMGVPYRLEPVQVQ